MESIEAKRALRLAFMKRLYELTDGNELVGIPLEQLTDDLDWDLRTAESVFDYLIHEGLIDSPGLSGEALITHRGVREVEDALSRPQQATEYFPPVVTVHVGGDLVGSQIQAGTVRSTQEQTVALDQHREAIVAFVDEMRRALSDSSVDTTTRAEGQASLVAVEAQLQLDKPNPTLLREGLRSLRAIAENLVASGMWLGLGGLIQRLPSLS